MILPFTSPDLNLASSGGKGANLARLSQAGFPVPDGFIVTTAAYQAFVDSNRLDDQIHQALEKAGAAPDKIIDPQALQEASTVIRNAFSTRSLPPGLVEALRQAYHDLGMPAVAVRSSATAEDLPEMSFAGQQDTFLNILGEDALQVAVVSCWSSLWTARAIGYRARNGLSQDDLALAVVVQRMVQSQVSGVLFTANPVSGLRSQTVIDATLGLGEALVSGQVEPDQYLVDTAAAPPVILSKTLGDKALAIHSSPGGGTHTVRNEAGQVQALPDSAILELVGLGQRIQDEYQGVPQDIEWGWADDRLYLLQARPVTSLYPLPDGLPAEPLQVMISFGAAQGMLEPITPFGINGIQALMVGAAGVLGYKRTIASQQAFLQAGERLFINITALIRNPIGRKALRTALNIAEAGSLPALLSVWDDPRLAPGRHPLSPGTALRLLRQLVPTFFRFLRTLAFPGMVREASVADLDAIVARCAAGAASAHTLAERLALFDQMFTETPRLMIQRAIPLFAPGLMMLNAILRLTRDLPEHDLAMEVTRGLPYNVTTEMDLVLWETAQRIRSDRLALQLFLEQPAAALTLAYQQDRLPQAAQSAVHDFLQRYHMRGVGEVDIGRPRWGEDPSSVMQSLQSYLRIQDPERAPDLVFQRGAASAEQAVETLAAALRKEPGGWLKARLLRGMARRVRGLAGLREYPKFTAVRLMGILRIALLASGQDLVAAGVCEQPEDIFYLKLEELRELSLQPSQIPDHLTTKLHDCIVTRKAHLEREKLRRQIPHLLVSDGRVFYEGWSESARVDQGETDANVILGSPVSAGVVEGLVRVVLDPFQADLQPGEILVCPGTDPAWTPLFLAAGGLVMEVGGLMTHGSVVAREYGIPAVVGVTKATQRLQTGMRIRLDGTSGRIMVIRSNDIIG